MRYLHWLSWLAYKKLETPFEFRRLKTKESDEYLADVRYLLDSPAFLNETERLKKQAADAIIRHTKTGEETAFHRGGLVYLEGLKKRLQMLIALDKKK